MTMSGITAGRSPMDGLGLLYGLMIDSDRRIKDTIWAVTIHRLLGVEQVIDKDTKAGSC